MCNRAPALVAPVGEERQSRFLSFYERISASTIVTITRSVSTCLMNGTTNPPARRVARKRDWDQVGWTRAFAASKACDVWRPARDMLIGLLLVSRMESDGRHSFSQAFSL
jgi:hypothetical protein